MHGRPRRCWNTSRAARGRRRGGPATANLCWESATRRGSLPPAIRATWQTPMETASATDLEAKTRTTSLRCPLAIAQTYILDQHVAIVMDLESGPEVWNYPVYAYRVDYAPLWSGGAILGQLSLWAADDAVPPSRRHIGPLLRLSFTFQDGEWLARDGVRAVGRPEHRQTIRFFAWLSLRGRARESLHPLTTKSSASSRPPRAASSPPGASPPGTFTGAGRDASGSSRAAARRRAGPVN